MGDVINQQTRIGASVLNRTSLAWKMKCFSFLWQKLYKTGREMQERIMDLLIVVENEDVTIELIQVNEDLNNALLGCERWAEVHPFHPLPLVVSSRVTRHSCKSTCWVNTRLRSRLPSFQERECDPGLLGGCDMACKSKGTSTQCREHSWAFSCSINFWPQQGLDLIHLITSAMSTL